MSDQNKQSPNNKLDIKYLIEKSPNIKKMIGELKSSSSMSVTGIVNFVVNYENPYLVEEILKKTYSTSQLFNGTVKFDAIELQYGKPGKGASVRYFDELIYGTYKIRKNKAGEPEPDIDEQTGVIRRNEDGLVTRSDLRKKPNDGGCKDRILLINNVDWCLDWCKPEDPGKIDTRALFLLDKFRNPMTRLGCLIVLITNEKLDLPFTVNTVELTPVSEFEVKHILNLYIKRYKDRNVKVIISESEIKQIVRKLAGLTYSSACDTLGYCFLRSIVSQSDGTDVMDMAEVLKILRTKINNDLMEGGFGLTQLHSRPWEDYICPEQSNFTHDVNKLMRDFREVDLLISERKKVAEDLKKKKSQKKFQEGLQKIEVLEKTIEDLETRMPHVIVLYGQGGVGKSAFPIHLAGLLGMDVWDFNINATHSKWIGQGSEQMRKSLEKITSTSHIVIRIDEYDRAIGSTNERGGGMHEAHKQVESEFMNWLQNTQEENMFQKRNIFVVLTTNHVENITGPMLRSGRADLVIDIGHFDSASMKETFETCARRMYNRGVTVVGFESQKELQSEIDKLDLEKLSEIAMTKKFTVRDIEMLVIEMGAYKYYYDKYADERGIPWTTEAFAKILENSEGSVKGASTGELKLGDRDYYNDDPEEVKVEFEDSVTDVEKLKKTKGFQEE
jgi:DNA polymerase III delta prime subunit